MSSNNFKKSLKKVSRFGLIFFILFFAVSAFFVVPVQADKINGSCGPANGETFDSYSFFSSSETCELDVTFSNTNSVEISATKTKWTWECVGLGGGTTATGCYAFVGTEENDTASGDTASGDTIGIIEYDNPLSTDNIIDVVERVADYFYYVAIAIVPIITIYAAILFLTAAGNEQQVGKARKTFVWLIIGIAILLIGSGVITLLKDILNVN